MQGIKLEFNIYANSQEEVDVLKSKIVEFINGQAKEGRAVSAIKLSAALDKLQGNMFIRSQVNKYFE